MSQDCKAPCPRGALGPVGGLQPGDAAVLGRVSAPSPGLGAASQAALGLAFSLMLAGPGGWFWGLDGPPEPGCGWEVRP